MVYITLFMFLNYYISIFTFLGITMWGGGGGGFDSSVTGVGRGHNF